jgi:hypothetical protein
MRSWSIHVGRLFGVEVRLHLTFLILPLFVFWTEYSVHPSANGPRDLALVGIVLACVAAHEIGHMLMARSLGLIPKAVILLPLSGVTVFDESRVEKPETAEVAWKRDVRIALTGPLVNLVFALVAAGIILLAGVGQSLHSRLESSAGISSGWGSHSAGLFRAQHRCRRCHPPRRLHQPCSGHDFDGCGFVQQYLADHGGRHYFFGGAA